LFGRDPEGDDGSEFDERVTKASALLGRAKPEFTEKERKNRTKAQQRKVAIEIRASL